MMQLVAIIGSLEGYTSNWEAKIISDAKYAGYAANHSDQLFALRPYLEQGHW